MQNARIICANDFPHFVAKNHAQNNKKRETTPHFVALISVLDYKKRKMTHFVALVVDRCRTMIASR